MLDAAAGATPVAAAWALFVERGVPTNQALDEVAGELASALMSAASAYTRAESTASTSLEGAR